MNLANCKYDELIMSYLEGRCSSEEAIGLLSWLAESESHRAYFDSFKEVWDLTAFSLPEQVDVEAALDAVSAKIDAIEEQPVAKIVEMPWLRMNYKLVSGLAAAVIVALFLGFLVKPWGGTVSMASSEWSAETPYLLPDGSSVTFKGDAEIAYAKQYGKTERSVDFEGIGYFDVVKNAEKPFVVHCGNVDVEVLGTTFLLDATKNASRLTVDLYTGKVRMTIVDKKDNVLESIELQPGERGVFDFTENTLRTLSYPQVKQEELATDHVLDFNDVELATIVETLEYIFDIEIDLLESYSEEKLTVRFTDNDSVDEVIETIATVFDLEVSLDKGVYVIR